MPTGVTVFYGYRSKQYYRRLEKRFANTQVSYLVIMVLGMGATSMANHYYVSVRVAWSPLTVTHPEANAPLASS